MSLSNRAEVHILWNLIQVADQQGSIGTVGDGEGFVFQQGIATS